MTLLELRESEGWSLQDLSNRTGISRPMISMLENGTRKPSLATMNTLARAFGITTSELVAALEGEK